MSEENIYSFLISRFTTPEESQIKILDFGCGGGDFVKYVSEKGLDCMGADTYFDSFSISDFQNSHVKDKIIILDKTGVIPFSDKSIDYITSIQVFEHVKDLKLAILQLRRILKDDGKIICTFPFKYSYIEGHYRIPCSHWFSPQSKLRKTWVKGFYQIGFGVKKSKSQTFEEWYREAFYFIDNYCFYRTPKQFFDICRETDFNVKFLDKTRLLFKLNSRKGGFSEIIVFILGLIPRSIISFFLRHRGSVIIELSKIAK